MINHLGIIMGAVYEIIAQGGAWNNADIESALTNMPNWIIHEAIRRLERDQLIENIALDCVTDSAAAPAMWVLRVRRTLNTQPTTE